MPQPDAIEHQFPDPETAHHALTALDPTFLKFVETQVAALRHRSPDEHAFLVAMERALWIGYARLAQRHGSWGRDPHPYHNEYHAQEIIKDRIKQIERVAQPGEFSVIDWGMLALFAVTHDLRQRETAGGNELVGPNEHASAAEAKRILIASGFDPHAYVEIHETLQMMIGGSTFLVKLNGNSGGATADKLISQASSSEDWTRGQLRWRAQMMKLAADIDTANVSESFESFAAGSARLCEELESRRGRAELSHNSATSVLHFLTTQQEIYFFELQRFSSNLGIRAFAAPKQANGPLLHRLVAHLRVQFPQPVTATGQNILQEFLDAAETISADS